MKYFKYPYVNNNETDIKIGLIHYILTQNASNGQTFIPAKFVQPFFRDEKYSLKDLYQILYGHKFIERVVTKQGTFGLNYYKVTINDCTLPSYNLPSETEVDELCEKHGTSLYKQVRSEAEEEKRIIKTILKAAKKGMVNEMPKALF